MTEKVVLGALVGATIGFGIGFLGSRTGGTCPIMCNPYIAAGFGLVLGGLFASSTAGGVRDYTPSPHLMKLESQEDFEKHVLEGDGVVLLEFSRPGCHYCRKLEPTMHELADKYAGRVKVVKVDTTQLPGVAGKYDIQGVPTLFLFKGGDVAKKMVGYREKSELNELLNQHALEETAATEGDAA